MKWRRTKDYLPGHIKQTKPSMITYVIFNTAPPTMATMNLPE
jgi:hypothetical protein